MAKDVEGTHQIGDLSLYTKSWLTDGPPKAKVVFIHGFNDHINRYFNLFPYLASRGIEVHGFDQRGWGRSVHNPSQRGRSGPTSLVISDIVSFIKAHLPSEVPLFVVAHSMGGGEALTLASDPQYKDLMGSIRGWVLNAPLVGLAKDSDPSAVTVFFGRLAGRVLPHRTMVAGLPAERCTRDPEVVKSMEGDTLLHRLGTLEGLAGMLDRTADLKGGRAKLNEGVRSLWLGHGTGDRVNDYDASKEWFDRQVTLKDKEFKTYEGWSHQLHADLMENREVFAKDVADWILARTGEGVSSKL